MSRKKVHDEQISCPYWEVTGPSMSQKLVSKFFEALCTFLCLKQITAIWYNPETNMWKKCLTKWKLQDWANTQPGTTECLAHIHAAVYKRVCCAGQSPNWHTSHPLDALEAYVRPKNLRPPSATDENGSYATAPHVLRLRLLHTIAVLVMKASKKLVITGRRLLGNR